MTLTPRWLATGLALVGLALLWPPDGAARNLDIAAFYGHWKGSAVSESEISLYFRLTARDIDVRVAPLDGGGFRLSWATIQRQKGDPDNPDEELKSTTVDFMPTDRPRIWRAAGATDPMSDEPYLWARLEETTLTVYSMGIRPDGAFELQVYKRTLMPEGMKLVFTRLVDGEPVRRAEGRLIKFGN